MQFRHHQRGQWLTVIYSYSILFFNYQNQNSQIDHPSKSLALSVAVSSRSTERFGALSPLAACQEFSTCLVAEIKCKGQTPKVLLHLSHFLEPEDQSC